MADTLTFHVLSRAIAKRIITEPVDRVLVLNVADTFDAERGHRTTVEIVKTQDGFLSFWKGLPIGLVSDIAAPYLTTLFKQFISQYVPKQNLTIITMLARVALCYPPGTIHSRIVAEEGDKSALEIVKDIAKNDGILGFFPGMILSLAGVVLYRSAFLNLHQSYRSLLPRAIVPVAAMISAHTVVYPIYTIRVKVMAESGNENKHYNGSIIKALSTTYREEGIMGFYRGYHISLLKSFLNLLIETF